MKPKIFEVKAYVAKRYGVSIDMLIIQCRMRKYARPRQIAMAVAARVCGRPLSHIARSFERDRKTVCHAVKKFEGDWEVADIAARFRNLEP